MRFGQDPVLQVELIELSDRSAGRRMATGRQPPNCELCLTAHLLPLLLLGQSRMKSVSIMCTDYGHSQNGPTDSNSAALAML